MDLNFLSIYRCMYLYNFRKVAVGSVMLKNYYKDSPPL